MEQKTFKRSFQIEGIGLHSGLKSVMTFYPAKENTGIVFEKDSVEIKALYDNVGDTQNCTCLKKDGATVSTIEHLMSALYITGVDNAYIKVSNPELPIMDGSAKVLLERLNQEEIVSQSAPKKRLIVKKTVRFEDDKGNFIELTPPKKQGLHIYFKIEFDSQIVGTQIFDADITPTLFANEIAPARTFCEKYQIDYLRAHGLIKGGSLDNAVVLDGEKILNPEGFRVKNECVNHKVLDLIGDMYTAGYAIEADIKAYRTGHFHNNAVLKKLFENKENYEIAED